jgi:hypothetical protein
VVKSSTQNFKGVGTYRLDTLTYMLQVKTKSGACSHKLPCVLHYQTLPPSQGGLQGCHVSSSSRTCLPDRKGSDTVTCIAAPDPLGGLWCTTCPTVLDPASLVGGLRVTTRPAVSFGSRASSIKKSLACLPVQLGLHVPNAHAHVSKAPDVRAIMGLQDMRADSAINVCKTCRHAATVQRRPY